MSNVNHKSSKQRIKERINASRIVGQLLKHIFGEKDAKGIIVEMSQTQVTAALRLLNKVVPDLKAVEQKISISDDRVLSKQEIDDRLIAKGLDPKEVWKSVTRH